MINQATINLVKKWEGLHDGDLRTIGLQPKMCPAGIWTEGYGRAMRFNGKFLRGKVNEALANKIAKIKTEAQAIVALKEDLAEFEIRVKSKVKRQITPNQLGALTSHTYNTGGSDTLFKLVNQGASDMVIRNWFETKYVTAEGVKLKGLVIRRKDEANLYFTK